VADIDWQLRDVLGRSRIDPAVPPIKWLHPFDMAGPELVDHLVAQVRAVQAVLATPGWS
jgi:hypothetical protein